jgi:23S rRNA (pseudouridine1915-N3)-methyltransferase
MKIKIIQVGKFKDKYLEESVNEYIKRINPYFKIELITLKDVSPSKTYPPERCKKEESYQILNAIDEGDFTISLDEHGKEMTSIDFAKDLSKLNDMGRTVSFIIGGAQGLDSSIISRSEKVLSFSKMTFTHQMIRLFLVEQIYRAGCIIRGKEYHVA